MLDKIFDHKSFEENFSFDVEASTRKPSAEPFMVLLPPPNVTGSLHMGHALCYTLQDITARYKRMRGYDVLFQPGLDHAGIVTQLLVEKQIYSSGAATKGSLTRNKLLKEIWFWKENSGDTIYKQMKRLGISCDYSRSRFTLDDHAKKAVTKMFVQMHKAGLLYRGQRMVNWDPMICTAISDLEVVEKEIAGHLWHIKYETEDGRDAIIIATSRPETIFGDVAVVVNPNDHRYKKFIGKKVKVPLIDRLIPVLEDKHADPKKGTGAVKITPAHDFNDYEVGQRHKLPIIDIFDEKAELNDKVPEMFQHMDRFEAREKVIDLIDKKGLLVKVEDVIQRIPFGDRSGVALEPRLTYQWFVSTERLAKAAIKVVREEKIKFVPKHWENLYFEWLENIRPWCISRQIWWGHEIPAWYGPDGQIFIAETEAEAHKQAVEYYGKNEVHLKKDNDVLDTWFSSGMWPFITLGWPEDSSDLKRFYSNMIVVTGFDIIFFWVSRMIMMSLFAIKEVPFKEVYIHGLVRDEHGSKMSKSKGNVINPLELCDQYGADALRYTLASLASPGRDLKMSSQLVETGRSFLTKLWNVVRFAQMHGCAYNDTFDPNAATYPINQWIIGEVRRTVKEVEEALGNYRYDDASRSLYQGVWNSLCDWFVEFSKPILQVSFNENGEEEYDLNQTILRKDVRDTFAWALVQLVKMFYPIAPFISKKLLGELGVISISWPDMSKVTLDCTVADQQVDLLKDVISTARSVKKSLRLPLNAELKASLEFREEGLADFIQNNSEIIQRMANIIIVPEVSRSLPVVLNSATLHIEISKNFDVKSEVENLRKDVNEFTKMRDAAMFRLNNEAFIQKAAPDVIEEHNKRVATLNDKITRTEYILRSLESVQA